MKSPLPVPPQSQTHFRPLSSLTSSHSGQPLGKKRNAGPREGGRAIMANKG